MTRILVAGEGRESLRSRLEGLGHEVLTVETIDEIPAAAASSEPLVVIVDVASGGTPAAKALGSQLGRAVVLLSDEPDTEMESRFVPPLIRIQKKADDASLVLAIRAVLYTRALEQKWGESEERWKFAIEASGQAVWDWNVQTDEMYSSPRWKEMVGGDPSASETLNAWDQRIHPDDRKRVHEEIRRYFRGQTPHYESEHRVLAADGSILWVLDRGKIVGWTADGKPLRVVGTHTDITRRKKAEEALAGTNEFLRDILESSSAISIISTDAEGNILFWNSGAENLLGYTADDVVGKKRIDEIYALESEHTSRAVEEIREAVLRSKRTATAELQEVHKDGRRLWVKVTVAPRIDRHGAVQGMLGVGEDLSAQIAARENSEQRGREMRLLAFTLDCAKDGFCITDLDNKILYVNESFRSMYGYDEEELLGKTIEFLRSPSVPEGLSREIHAMTRDGGWSGEILNRRKDGSEFTVEVYASVVRNDQGEPVAMVGVARDVTERKRAEERIRDSLREKEVLLKEIHHRVKNNLQVITSLLNLQSAKVSSPETAAALKESQTRIRSMALVHEELYRSRDLASIDFSSYVRKLTSNLFHAYQAAAVEIALHLDVVDVYLPVDTAIPCGLIVNELISNSLKYAFAKRTSGKVTVAFRHDGPAYRLQVSDDGVGLPAHIDLDRTETLGLQLVATLAKQLRGEIAVDRSGGTTFTLAFTLSGRSTHE
jgi:PAS domain S-box-containing protein